MMATQLMNAVAMMERLRRCGDLRYLDGIAPAGRSQTQRLGGEGEVSIVVWCIQRDKYTQGGLLYNMGVEQILGEETLNNVTCPTRCR